jgi:hypothetical protein
MNVSQSAAHEAATSPKRSSRAEPAETVVHCPDCREQFATGEAFDAHQRSEADRTPPTVKFLRGAPSLPKCLSPSTLWSIGWRRSRPNGPRSAQRAPVWTMPPVPKKRAHRVSEGGVYECSLCRKRKHFSIHVG